MFLLPTLLAVGALAYQECKHLQRPQVFKIGIFFDYELVEKARSKKNLKDLFEDGPLRIANEMTQRDLNITLEVKRWDYGKRGDSHWRAGDCRKYGMQMSNMLKEFGQEYAMKNMDDVGSWILMTNCLTWEDNVLGLSITTLTVDKSGVETLFGCADKSYVISSWDVEEADKGEEEKEGKLFAHELGHILGSKHTPKGVMRPIVSTQSPMFFSDGSTEAICRTFEMHLQEGSERRDGCISYKKTSDPQPTFNKNWLQEFIRQNSPPKTTTNLQPSITKKPEKIIQLPSPPKTTSTKSRPPSPMPSWDNSPSMLLEQILADNNLKGKELTNPSLAKEKELRGPKNVVEPEYNSPEGEDERIGWTLKKKLKESREELAKQKKLINPSSHRQRVLTSPEQAPTAEKLATEARLRKLVYKQKPLTAPASTATKTDADSLDKHSDPSNGCA